MDIKQLKQYLENLTQSLKSKNHQLLKARLGSLISVFPFNEYEYILMFLLDREIITFQEYEKLREKYVASNPYLELYGIATGLVIMVLAFGPGIFFLFRERFEKMKPRTKRNNYQSINT